MSKSSLLLSRFKNSRSYSRDNYPTKKETKSTMAVIMSLEIAVTMAGYHWKQSLQNLENHGKHKIVGALGIGANGTNIGLHHTIKKLRTQNDTATDKTDNTKYFDEKSFKINMESLESDNTTNKCFGMIESAEANNHVASDELEGIFDANMIHCKEVKYSTSDDSEQSKD